MGAGLSSLRAGRKRSKGNTPCAPTPAENTQVMALKDLGNEHFRAGKYKEAEELYSHAFVFTH
jgi:hypothetical protein